MKNIFYASFVAFQPCAFSSISWLALVTKFNPWFSAVIWSIIEKLGFSLMASKPAINTVNNKTSSIYLQWFKQPF